MKNPNCDNDKCLKSEGEIRVLPSGGDSNLLLCYGCYRNEMIFRLERNKELEHAEKFKIPVWQDLKIYN